MNWNLMTILNVCTTEDAQISWGVRADSALYCRPVPYPSWESYQTAFLGLASHLLSHKGWLHLLTPGKLCLSLTLCLITAPSPPSRACYHSALRSESSCG